MNGSPRGGDAGLVGDVGCKQSLKETVVVKPSSRLTVYVEGGSSSRGSAAVVTSREARSGTAWMVPQEVALLTLMLTRVHGGNGLVTGLVLLRNRPQVSPPS